MKLPVTQITQQAKSKSKMLRNKIKVNIYTDANTVDTPMYYQACPGLVRNAISFLLSHSNASAS